MRTIVSGQSAATPQEFAELALGIDTELFTGPAQGETAEERAARLDAARDIIDDLRPHDPELAAYAERLLASAPVPIVRPSRRSVVQGLWGSGVAA